MPKIESQKQTAKHAHNHNKKFILHNFVFI